MDNSKILLIDNYDSFTFNLVNVLRKVTKQFEVRKNDEIDLGEIDHFDKIMFSPGPDIPHQNDMMWQILDLYKSTKSILGICLGFQSIGLYFGAKLFNLKTVYHGQTREIDILDKNDYLFKDIPAPFTGGLYHSWGLLEDDFPEGLIITAKSNENRIMALRHKVYDIRGVQFHPESIMTQEGERMIGNWVRGEI
jgi:anthranilate synthase component 2